MPDKILCFFYPSKAASVVTTCLQVQSLVEFFTQNFHQGFLAHLLPSAVVHLQAIGASAEFPVVSFPNMSLSVTKEVWLNLQETTFLPTFLLQQGFPSPEKVREMLITIIRQYINRFIICLPFHNLFPFNKLQLPLVLIKEQIVPVSDV